MDLVSFFVFLIGLFKNDQLTVDLFNGAIKINAVGLLAIGAAVLIVMAFMTMLALRRQTSK